MRMMLETKRFGIVVKYRHGLEEDDDEMVDNTGGSFSIADQDDGEELSFGFSPGDRRG